MEYLTGGQDAWNIKMTGENFLADSPLHKMWGLCSDEQQLRKRV